MKKTILLLLLVLMLVLNSLSGTALASPGKNFFAMSSPTSQNLAAAWGTAADNVYAVGDNGVILHYDGNTWTIMTSGTQANLESIWGTSNNNIYAVGWSSGGTYTGHILHYNGNSWSTVKTVPDVSFYGVGGAGSYVCASGSDMRYDYGVIYLKEGSAWTRKYTSPYYRMTSYNDIWGYSYYGMQDYIYLVGEDIYDYNSEVILFQPELIDPVSVEESISGLMLNGVWGAAPSEWHLFAVGGKLQIVSTIQHYDFSNWDSQIDYTTELNDVWGVSASDVYTVGTLGKILHYDGTRWNSVKSGTTKYLNGVWGSSSTDFFAVGNDGVILRLNTGPDKPKLVSPAGAATNVSLTPTLQSSAFSDPDPGDTHAASRWQITATPSDYSSPVYDSGVDTANKISLTVPGGTLTGNTVYYWRVRYKDNNGAWSEWSGQRSFTTIVMPPAVSSLNPVSAAPGDAISVVIAGENLNGATEVSFPGILIENFTVDNPTQITAVINIPFDAVDGPRDVSVTTPGGVATLADGFIVEPVLGPPIQVPVPAIDSIDPVSATQGDAVSISITGSNFYEATEVDFGQGISVDSFTVDNTSQITASIDIALDAAAGTRNVSVTTTGGIATLTVGFTVEELLLQPEPEPTPLPIQENQTQVQNQTQNQTEQGTYQGEQKEQNQTGQQTQDQGQSQNLTIQEQARVRNMIQEREREMNQSLQSLPQWQQNVYQNQNQVILAVHALLAMENLTGGIGHNISQIAREFNNSVQATIRAEERIQTRNQLVKFFMGGDEEAAQEILNVTNMNQLRIQQLKQLRLECNCIEEVKAMIQEQIQNMEQEQTRLQQLAQSEIQNKGLFGWLLGIFVR
jgi:hypothetical protein